MAKYGGEDREIADRERSGERIFCRSPLGSHALPHTHTHTRLTALFPGLPGWAGTRKIKSIWILLKQETVSGSGISWAVCQSAPHSRQITTPAPHRSVFYRPDALPAAEPTASKQWRQICCNWHCVRLEQAEPQRATAYAVIAS